MTIKDRENKPVTMNNIVSRLREMAIIEVAEEYQELKNALLQYVIDNSYSKINKIKNDSKKELVKQLSEYEPLIQIKFKKLLRHYGEKIPYSKC